MDPKAALELANDKEATDEDREGALSGLAAWIARGGFMPAGGPGVAMHPTLNDETMTWAATMGLLELASALRVALADGDTSGLTYVVGDPS